MGLVIGVTGGTGAGKTTVVSILNQLGMERLDVDRVAHKFLLPGSPVFEALVAAFGEEYRQENGIDRKRLGRLVFSSPAHRRKLEELVHPLLKEEVAQVVQAAREAGIDLVLDHPLLFEMEMEGLVDEIWTVTVPGATGSAGYEPTSTGRKRRPGLPRCRRRRKPPAPRW